MTSVPRPRRDALSLVERILRDPARWPADIVALAAEREREWLAIDARARYARARRAASEAASRLQAGPEGARGLGG